VLFNLIQLLLVAYLSAFSINAAGDLHSRQPESISVLLSEIDRHVDIARVGDAFAARFFTFANE
jgi:hypothetical protein